MLKTKFKIIKDLIIKEKELSILIFFITIFTILKIIYVQKFAFLIWDETVYISMGKYLLNGGNSGFFEAIRPIVLPLYLGLFTKLGVSNFVVLKFLIVPFAVISSLLIFLIGKETFNKKVGLFAALAYLTCSTIFRYSSFILTGIMATTFMLASIYLLIKKKPIWTGIFATLSILTRFPFGIYLFCLAIFILFKLFIAKGTKLKFKVFHFGLIIAITIICTVIPFLIFNYASYVEETSSAYDAALRPFLLGNQDMQYKASFSLEPLKYYLNQIITLNPVLLFGIIGLLILLPKTFKNYNLLFLMISGAFMAFFTYYNDTLDIRFYIPVIAITSLYVGIFLDNMINLFSGIKLKNISSIIQKYQIPFLVIIILFGLTLSTNGVVMNASSVYNPTVHELYDFLNEHNIEGPVLSTMPFIGAHVSNPIDVAYYKYNSYGFHRFLSTKDYAYLIITDSMFKCQEDNLPCENKEEVLEIISNDYMPIFETEKNNEKYFVMTQKTDSRIKPLEKDIIPELK